MTFILSDYNWVLIFVALVTGGLLLWPTIKGGGGMAGGGSVGTAEAVRLINREKAVLVDVSEPAEYAAAHAAQARNVPLAQIAAGAKGLPTNKSLPVVLVCPTGKRSQRAAAELRKAGYEKVVVLAGGTAAWRDASLPVETSAA